jgi:methyl-accepting chemotaxis protein
MSKKRSVYFSITAKLLLIFLSVLIIVNILLGTIAYKISSNGMRDSVINHMNAISTDIANQIAAINEKHFQTLHVIAELDIIKDENATLAQKQQEIVNVIHAIGDNCIDMAFYDANGDCLLADGRSLNFKDRVYFKTAYEGNDFVSDPKFSTVTNTVLQHYSVPVYNKKNKIIGAVVMVIQGNTALSTIEQIDLGLGMHPSIINWKEMTTVANANPNTDENQTGQTEMDDTQGLGLVLTNIFAGKEDVEDFIDPNIGMHLIAAYKKIPKTNWTVFAVAPYDYYFESVYKMQNYIIVVMVISVLISALLITLLVRLLVRPLKTVKSSITTIASGNADLTQRIPESSNDEIGAVVQGFNGFVQKLQDIVTNLQASKSNLTSVDSDLQLSTQNATSSITQIISNIESVNGQILSQAESVQETAGAVNEISATIESLDRLIESQSTCVSQASSSVEEMIQNINSVSESVTKMIDSFNQLEQNSSAGMATQKNANEKIMRIEEQSKMLQDANIAIASIAEQTNLLAMNAAIEAAHAGTAGKGFAVVADEIRKLSETSSVQSKTIGAELKNIKQTILEVVSVSNDTNNAFSAISESISETSQILEQIKGAMEEQQIGSKQIIDALGSMNNSTAEVKTAAAEMTEGNKQILSEVQKLQLATDTIKESIHEMHQGAEHINQTGADLFSISGKMADNIKQIGSEIDLFKI